MKKNKLISYGDYWLKINSHTRKLEVYSYRGNYYPSESYTISQISKIKKYVKSNGTYNLCPNFINYHSYGLVDYNYIKNRQEVKIGCTKVTKQKFYSIVNKVLNLK